MDDPSAAERGYQRHLLQVGYADVMIGRLLRRLKATGMYDRSLLVVTADHGLSFHAGEPFGGRTRVTQAGNAFVPLLVKTPGQKRARVVSTPAQTIDVLPTIADALGIELPWKVELMLAPLGRAPQRPAYRIYTPILSEPEEYGAGQLRAGLRAELRRKARLFGTGTLGTRLFQIGPRPELLGRPVGTLPRARAPGARASIDDARAAGHG